MAFVCPRGEDDTWIYCQAGNDFYSPQALSMPALWGWVWWFSQVVKGGSPSISENKFNLFLAIHLPQIHGTWNLFTKQIFIQHSLC